MDSHIDLDLLDRYIAGDCSAVEREDVARWLVASPDRSLAALRDRARYPEQIDDSARAWARVQQRVTLESADGGASSVPTRSGRNGSATWLNRAVGLFATTAMVAALTWIGWTRLAPTSNSATLRTYTTAIGEQARVTLDDGSRVVLGPSTTMTVSIEPSNGARRVMVNGQALFTVQHGTRAPFSVRTAFAETNVLGTTFFVRQYPTDQIARVVVADGRVAVQGIHANATISMRNVLAARAMGVIDNAGRVHVSEAVAVNEYTAWTMGELVFHDTPVRDVLDELERFYGVRFRLADTTLSSHVLTWTIPTTRSLSSVIEGLAALLESHVVRSDTAITIMPGPATPRQPRVPYHPFATEKQYGR